MKTIPQKTIDAIQDECNDMRGYTPEYYDKQMHKIPVMPVVDRVHCILEKCQEKHVLHLGCSWPPSPLHSLVVRTAKVAFGVDINVPEHPKRPYGYFQADLDAPLPYIPEMYEWDIILVAELLEHLGNPGNLLFTLKEYDKSILITVPNAFSSAGMSFVRRGIENVNKQHVAYYSYWTLKELVTRYKYEIQESAWYNGQPGTAEGLIFLIR